MRLVLVVPRTGEVAQNQRIVLDGAHAATVDLGGASDCEALLDDPSVGTTRVRLERQGGDWTIRDDEGAGTCVVGGVRLRARARRLLRAPLSLRLGTVECAIENEAALPEDGSTREMARLMVAGAGAVAGDAPVVRIAEGERMGEAITLARHAAAIVGRARDAALCLADPDVSRHHVSVAWVGERVLVTDLGSAGGTYLGASRLEPHRAAVWAPARMLLAGQTVLLLEATVAQHLLAGAMSAERSAPVEPSAPPPGPEPDSRTGDPEIVLPPSDAREPHALVEVAPAAPPRVPRPSSPDPRRLRLAVLAFVIIGAMILAATSWLLLSSG